MKKNHKLMTQIFAVTLALAFIPATFAFGGFGSQSNRPNEANRAAIEKAFDEGNYTAWKALLPVNLQKKMTEVKFKEMVAQHTEMEAHRETVEQAIAARNYAAWKTEVEKFNPESPLLGKITAQNFAKFAEMHSYREKAQKIETELGIEGCCGGMGKGGMMGREMGGGMGMMGGGMMGGKHFQK